MRRPVDLVSIVSGLAVTALGVLLLLDQTDAIDLRFDYTAPAVLATVGAVLLAAGLSPRERGDGRAARSTDTPAAPTGSAAAPADPSVDGPPAP
jgi:hypothetical protein